MIGDLEFSPADVVSRVLRGLGRASDPALSTVWPSFVGGEPDTPDNVITVYDTTGRDFGREGVTSIRGEHYGVQVRVRSITHPAGWDRAREIAAALDRASYEKVTIGARRYLLETFTRTNPIASLGEARSESPRRVFTINGTAVIRLV